MYKMYVTRENDLMCRIRCVYNQNTCWHMIQLKLLKTFTEQYSFPVVKCQEDAQRKRDDV